MSREKIDYLKIGNDDGAGFTGEFGWVYTKSQNLYYLWWELAWPDESTAVHHVRRSMWVSMLREAITHNLDVDFITESEYSSKVLTVKLFAP